MESGRPPPAKSPAAAPAAARTGRSWRRYNPADRHQRARARHPRAAASPDPGAKRAFTAPSGRACGQQGSGCSGAEVSRRAPAKPPAQRRTEPSPKARASTSCRRPGPCQAAGNTGRPRRGRPPGRRQNARSGRAPRRAVRRRRSNGESARPGPATSPGLWPGGPPASSGSTEEITRSPQDAGTRKRRPATPVPTAAALALRWTTSLAAPAAPRPDSAGPAPPGSPPPRPKLRRAHVVSSRPPPSRRGLGSRTLTPSAGPCCF